MKLNAPVYIIISEYLDGASLRSIAQKHKTNHHAIKRIFIRNGIFIRPRTRKPPKRKHIDRRHAQYANMMHHLRFDVTIDWLLQFEEFEKLSFLNRQITNRSNRFAESTEWYKLYIERFYYDEVFNKLYNTYLQSGKQKYLKLSLDHIIPKSLGGTNKIDNLRFITFFENMCKRDIPPDEWAEMKSHIYDYFS